ncbi:hypothetical protein BV25DRAFT_1989896 [Artomyces pyxidatus]|uniref:Uncharacterized protein n=1 Tax=Artomyces pyxidatus TaxID=48021 RepID=A0ACB8T840_9AGAM|nr:hypothetical protein BV25DRAFT_1989896 [Artomyces pyxidatus]
MSSSADHHSPGRIVACIESVHTPAHIALNLSPDEGGSVAFSTTTLPTILTGFTGLTASRESGPRPCLVMPGWSENTDQSMKDRVSVCVLATFGGAPRSELAKFFQYFNMPMLPHSRFRDDLYNESDYVVASRLWTKRAWLIAYPFEPQYPLLWPWKVQGVDVEVDRFRLLSLERQIQQRVHEWNEMISNDASALEQFRQDYRDSSKRYAARKQTRDASSKDRRRKALSIHGRDGSTSSFQSARPGQPYPSPRSPTRLRSIGHRVSAQHGSVLTSKPMNGSYASSASIPRPLYTIPVSEETGSGPKKTT